MGNSVQKPQPERQQSYPDNSPNVLIKSQKSGNVPIVKVLFQIIHADIVYESIDKIFVDLLIQALVDFQLTVYTYIHETKNMRTGVKFESALNQSTSQRFSCPKGAPFEFPSKYIEFMISDLIKFQKLQQNPESQYYNLVLEIQLKLPEYQLIYFYRIECDDQYQCQIKEQKSSLIYGGQTFQLNELYGVKNTPFHPKWDPSLTEDKECIICLANFINTVLLPCRHMCACTDCAQYIFSEQKNKLCPLCRQDLDNFLILEIKDREKKGEQIKSYQEQQIIFNESIAQKKQIQNLRQSQISEQLQLHQVERSSYKVSNLGEAKLNMNANEILNNFSAESDYESKQSQNEEKGDQRISSKHRNLTDQSVSDSDVNHLEQIILYPLPTNNHQDIDADSERSQTGCNNNGQFDQIINPLDSFNRISQENEQQVQTNHQNQKSEQNLEIQELQQIQSIPNDQEDNGENQIDFLFRQMIQQVQGLESDSSCQVHSQPSQIDQILDLNQFQQQPQQQQQYQQQQQKQFQYQSNINIENRNSNYFSCINNEPQPISLIIEDQFKEQSQQYNQQISQDNQNNDMIIDIFKDVLEDYKEKKSETYDHDADIELIMFD